MSAPSKNKPGYLCTHLTLRAARARPHSSSRSLHGRAVQTSVRRLGSTRLAVRRNARIKRRVRSQSNRGARLYFAPHAVWGGGGGGGPPLGGVCVFSGGGARGGGPTPPPAAQTSVGFWEPAHPAPPPPPPRGARGPVKFPPPPPP
eukprot:SAG11_NODE_5279_length_1603_cov_4.114058_1_plen_145_part_10